MSKWGIGSPDWSSFLACFETFVWSDALASSAGQGVGVNKEENVSLAVYAEYQSEETASISGSWMRFVR